MLPNEPQPVKQPACKAAKITDYLNALHRFYLVLIAWTQPDIEVRQQYYAEGKRYDGKVFITEIVKIYRVAVEYKKFARHPVGVGNDPAANGEVMIKFADEMARTNGDDDGKDQSWKDHGNTQRLPDHAPADIFQQPE